MLFRDFRDLTDGRSVYAEDEAKVNADDDAVREAESFEDEPCVWNVGEST